MTDYQIWILGIVATALVQLYKFIRAKYANVVVDKKTVQYVSMLVSVLLSLGYVLLNMGPVDFSDPVALIGRAGTLVASVFGMSTAMYLILFKRVAEGIGFSEDKYVTKESTPPIEP